MQILKQMKNKTEKEQLISLLWPYPKTTQKIYIECKQSARQKMYINIKIGSALPSFSLDKTTNKLNIICLAFELFLRIVYHRIRVLKILKKNRKMKCSRNKIA